MYNNQHTFTGEAKVSIRKFWEQIATNTEKRINHLNNVMAALEPQADRRWYSNEIARQQLSLKQSRQNVASLI